MIKLNSGVLLAFDVLRNRSDLTLPFGIMRKTWQGEGDIFLSEPGGEDVSVHMAEHVSLGLPSFFGEALKKAFVLVREEGAYRQRLCVLPLSPGQVSQILSEGVEGEAEVRSVVEFFIPKVEGSIWPVYLNRQFGSILLLDADGEVPSAGTASPEEVSALLMLLNQAGTAAAPFSLFDLLVFPAPWPRIPDDFTALVTRPGAVVEESSGIRLPLSAYDLAQFISRTLMIGHRVDQVKNLPLGRSSVSEYLARLSSRQGQTLSSYYNIYLRDREETLQTLLETQRMNEELLEKSRHNLVEVARRDLLSRSFLASLSHPLRLSLFNRLVRDRDRSVGDYQAAKQIVEARELAARDYLRDLVVAEATASNLEIQKRIRLLTAIAVIIGILALLSNLVPDTIKQSLCNKIGWCIESVSGKSAQGDSRSAGVSGARLRSTSRMCYLALTPKVQEFHHLPSTLETHVSRIFLGNSSLPKGTARTVPVHTEQPACE